MTEPTPAVWVDDLEPEVCFHLLSTREVGRVAFVGHGLPQVLPVNHRVDGHSVVFRTSEFGSLGDLVDGPIVAFQVDDADPATETGWSVLAHGILDVVTDDEVPSLDHLHVHPYAPDKHRWLRLRIDRISGRSISRPPTPGA